MQRRAENVPASFCDAEMDQNRDPRSGQSKSPFVRSSDSMIIICGWANVAFTWNWIDLLIRVDILAQSSQLGLCPTIPSNEKLYFKRLAVPSRRGRVGRCSLCDHSATVFENCPLLSAIRSWKGHLSALLRIILRCLVTNHTSEHPILIRPLRVTRSRVTSRRTTRCDPRSRSR